MNDIVDIDLGENDTKKKSLISNVSYLYCTENLFFPSFYSENNKLFSLLNFRYKVIRALTFKIQCISPSFPIIGGRTLIEIITILIGVLFCVYCCFYTNTSDSGSLVAMLGGMAIFLGLRNNIFTLLFSVSFERAIFWHKVVAVFSLIVGIIHGVISVLKEKENFDAGTSYESESNSVSYLISYNNITGLTLLLLMIFTSFSYYVKQNHFEYFYYFHFLMSIGICVASALHGAGFMCVAYGVWTCDVILRYFLTINKVPVIARVLDAEVIRFTLPKSFEYKAGQYCFISIPEMDIYQYHPFSISSAPYEDVISFHIRALGNWTMWLRNHIKAEALKNGNSSSYPSCQLMAHIEGPFGCPAIDIENNYEVILLLSGGIGVTPLQAIFNDLLFQYNNHQKKLRKVIFIWSVKDKAMIKALDGEENGTFLSPEFDSPLSFVPNLLFNSNESYLLGSQSMAKKKAVSKYDVFNSKSIASEEVFHAEFYLTSIRSKESFKLANIDSERQTFLHFGRPNCENIFDQVNQLCMKENIKSVGVVTCGPEALTRDITRLCNATYPGNTSFELQKEIFDF